MDRIPAATEERVERKTVSCFVILRLELAPSVDAPGSETPKTDHCIEEQPGVCYPPIREAKMEVPGNPHAKPQHRKADLRQSCAMLVVKGRHSSRPAERQPPKTWSLARGRRVIPPSCGSWKGFSYGAPLLRGDELREPPNNFPDSTAAFLIDEDSKS